MSVKSIMISNAESVPSAGYMAAVFWKQNIAKVSSITLIPYLKNGKIAQMAYVDIANWCDSEAAYNFLQRLKMPEGEARIHYNMFDENWWAVQINTHYNGQLLLGSYTETFHHSAFNSETQDMSLDMSQEMVDDQAMYIEELSARKIATEEWFEEDEDWSGEMPSGKIATEEWTDKEWTKEIIAEDEEMPSGKMPIQEWTGEEWYDIEWFGELPSKNSLPEEWRDQEWMEGEMCDSLNNVTLRAHQSAYVM